MRFFKNFKRMLSPSILAENTLKANEDTYYILRKKFPNKREHDYLAMTYAARRRAGVIIYKDGITEEQISLLSYTETHQFAVLEPPNSIRALALYILYKERPDLITDEYRSEYAKLYTPILQAKEDGTFGDWYERTNPSKS